MKNKRIVFNGPEGIAAVITPNPDCGLTIDQIAAKDVPNGVAFKVVDASEIPADREYRDAWEVDHGTGRKRVKVNVTKRAKLKLINDRRKAKEAQEAAEIAALDAG